MGYKQVTAGFPSPSFFLSLAGLCSSRERAVQPLTGCYHTCQCGVAGWVPMFSQPWLALGLWWPAASDVPCPVSTQDTLPHTSNPLRYSSILPELQRSCAWAACFWCGVPLCWSQVPKGLLSPRYLLCFTQDPWVFSDGHLYPFRDIENSG